MFFYQNIILRTGFNLNINPVFVGCFLPSRPFFEEILYICFLKMVDATTKHKFNARWSIPEVAYSGRNFGRFF